MMEEMFFQAVKPIKPGAAEWKHRLPRAKQSRPCCQAGGSEHAYLLAFSVYKGKLQVLILNGFVCPVGG